jgi:murein DD-endopeptidase MepM/ murein hydrolase activator NlpD
MTNTIQFPLSLAGAVSNNGSISKQSATLENSGFNDLFSTLLSDLNSVSGAGDISSSSGDLMTSMIMTLFSKLFGADTSALNLQTSKPQGNPVNGVLTQSSHEGHVALDFGVPIGTNVKSTMEGKVTYAGWNNEGYGNLVIVENGAYKTYYAHLSSIPVRKGQTVKEGEVIGLSGNTGNSTGPHLHYEIRKDGVALNPLVTI